MQCNTKDGIFQKKWHLEYIINRDYDFAFHIKDMGLFFLNVSINSVGDLVGLVQIVNCTAVSRQFTYTLEVVAPRRIYYTGPVRLMIFIFKSDLHIFSDTSSKVYIIYEQLYKITGKFLKNYFHRHLICICNNNDMCVKILNS